MCTDVYSHTLCSCTYDTCCPLPEDEPGVYIMESTEGRKLYIGKSVKLSSRVPSYFNTSGDLSANGEHGDPEEVLPASGISRRISVMTGLVER